LTPKQWTPKSEDATRPRGIGIPHKTGSAPLSSSASGSALRTRTLFSGRTFPTISSMSTFPTWLPTSTLPIPRLYMNPLKQTGAFMQRETEGAVLNRCQRISKGKMGNQPVEKPSHVPVKDVLSFLEYLRENATDMVAPVALSRSGRACGCRSGATYMGSGRPEGRNRLPFPAS